VLHDRHVVANGATGGCAKEGVMSGEVTAHSADDCARHASGLSCTGAGAGQRHRRDDGRDCLLHLKDRETLKCDRRLEVHPSRRRQAVVRRSPVGIGVRPAACQRDWRAPAPGWLGTVGITYCTYRNIRLASLFMQQAALSDLARLSVSLPADLLVQLDAMVTARGLVNRSQTIAELIRHELAEYSETQRDAVIAGTVTLVYRAESGRVRHALAQTQLAYLEEVISSQHVFLEDDQSLEVLLVQGPAARLRALCDELRKIRGVQQIRLVTTTALLPPLHAHGGGEAVDGPRGVRAKS
jgi:CopG family nickel-responsive transcriptional regulator